MTSSLTFAEALNLGSDRLRALASGRRDAELLLLHAAKRDRAWLFAHPESHITPAQLSAFEGWLERRARHEPVQYILGQQEFYGLSFQVTPDVLIPRPETEHLVEAALERLAPEPPSDRPLRVADVGTGSGAIAVALAHARPDVEFTATDLSAAALAVARENAEHHSVADRMQFVQADLLETLPREPAFDLIVSNPPYIADTEELEPQVGAFEPRTALFAGPTGLEIYTRLIPQAATRLLPGGWLLLEIGHGQRTAIATLLTGWARTSFTQDLQGIPRVAIARRPA